MCLEQRAMLILRMLPNLKFVQLLMVYIGTQPLGPYVTHTVRFFALMALIPFAVGLIDAWNAGLGFFLLIFGGGAAVLILLTLSFYKFWQGIRVAGQCGKFLPQIIAVVVTPILVVAWFGAALPILWAGEYMGNLSRLAVNETNYRDIVNIAQTRRKADWYTEHDGITYSVDIGPPVRIAFNPAGMLNNWSAIIFDPTGDVMLANGFDSKNGRFYAPERVTKLFGGNLVRCRSLWGDYYTCSFT